MSNNWVEGTNVFNDLCEEILFLRSPEDANVMLDSTLRIKLVLGVIKNLVGSGWDYTDPAVQETLAFTNDPIVEEAFRQFEEGTKQ